MNARSTLGWLVLALFALALFAIFFVRMTMPAHAGPYSPWFKSLHQPGTGFSCCDEADCKVTSTKFVNGRWRAALPTGDWVDVPEDRIIYDEAHPEGQAVLCALPGGQVYCFVPGKTGG